MGVTRPPLEYLAGCSKVSLESFELARLNEASNYRKEVQQILQGWIDTEVDARLARWILESKQSQADRRDSRRAAIAQPGLPLLDPSFLPADEAPAPESESQANPREANRRALPQREPQALPSAGEPAPGGRRKSSELKRVKLVEKCGSGKYLGASAPARCVPKPSFAQDEENARYELEHFVQRRSAASRARPQKFAAARDLQLLDQRPGLSNRAAARSRRGTNDRPAAIHVFPSTGTTAAAACRAYPIRAISMSALERELPVAAADC
jgi:hypothetical protein